MRKVLVWDVPTRLFHWLAAGLVAAAYVTWRLNWMEWHEWTGDALLALVIFRLCWGFFGSETARFSSFVGGPRRAWRHLSGVLRRAPDREIGHNPAGGWMVLLLLALLLGETLSGLYVAHEVADEGPLTELVPAPIANLITDLHAVLWQALLVAVALHVLAIVAYRVARGRDLLTPMITGRKRLPESERPPFIAGPTRALLLLAGSALVTAAIANLI